MYDTNDPSSRGPYYVPWKKTSMDLYKKTTNHVEHNKMKGYIPGSTIGNVPTDDKTKKDSDKK